MVLADLGLLAVLLAGQDASPDGDPPRVEPCETGVESLLVSGRFLDARVGLAAGGDREEGPAVLLRTTDGGAHWRSVAPDLAVRLYDVSFVDLLHGWAVGLGGTVLRTADGGETWQAVPVPEPCWLSCAWFLTREHGWVAGGDAAGLRLFETRDGGETWQDAREHVPETHRGRPWRDLWFRDASDGWAAGEDGALLHTTDGGARWQGVDLGSDAWLRAVAFQDGHGVVVGAQGTFRETTDGGATFGAVPVDRAFKFNDAAFDRAGGLWLATMDGCLLWRPAGQDALRVVLQRDAPLTKLSFPPQGPGFVFGDGGYVGRIPVVGAAR